MGRLVKSLKLTPLSVAAIPIVVLAVIFSIIALAAAVSDSIAVLSPAALLISGVCLYAATMVLLARLGLANVRELERVAHTDSLCGLPNRRALHADFEEHKSSGEEYALALIDLDGFKVINDHFGHFVGDALIKECARILRDHCEPEARCYRLGGDEFALTMTGKIAGTLLEGMCRNLIERFNQPIAIGSRRLSVGASIGLARSSGKDGLDSSELLRQADVAMYASKRGGRMRCTWFSSEFDRNREALQKMDAELRQALEKGEFELHYQPLVDADSGQIVAAESLIRWNRPDGKKIGPNIFIPVAEESGQINAIGLWVLRKACVDALEWGDIRLSVNISAAQLRNPEFPIELGHILEETGFPAERLELEITETCLVVDPIVAERSLSVIRGFGVNVSLDDFGTGYASIGFLRQFRFEKLKLDRSLVIEAGQDEGSRAMMLSSVTVARALKMGVTAEGVETEEQAALARTAGCDRIQGWLYYRAMPASDLTLLLRDQAKKQGAGADRRDRGAA